MYIRDLACASYPELLDDSIGCHVGSDLCSILVTAHCSIIQEQLSTMASDLLVHTPH